MLSNGAKALMYACVANRRDQGPPSLNYIPKTHILLASMGRHQPSPRRYRAIRKRTPPIAAPCAARVTDHGPSQHPYITCPILFLIDSCATLILRIFLWGRESASARGVGPGGLLKGETVLRPYNISGASTEAICSVGLQQVLT